MQLLSILPQGVHARTKLLFHHFKVSDLLFKFHKLLSLLSLLLFIFDYDFKLCNFFLSESQLGFVFPCKLVNVTIHDFEAGIAEVVYKLVKRPLLVHNLRHANLDLLDNLVLG